MEKPKTKIAIIGYGYVGKAYKRFFEDHYKVLIYDPFFNLKEAKKEKIVITKNKDAINSCDLAVVCVPTPTDKDNFCDISIVEEVISWLKTPVIFIKSTIPPKTTEKLRRKYKKRIVFSPEYISEGKYDCTYEFHTDAKKCPFVVLGGEQKDREYVLDLIVPIMGPQKKYIQMTATEAELVKYFENTYFGVKIMFAQEMYDICKIFEADYFSVREGWAGDPRVDPMHTMVFKNSRGFSGKCLPKDLNALVAASKKQGYVPIMLEAMLKSNKVIRQKAGLKLDY